MASVGYAVWFLMMLAVPKILTGSLRRRVPVIVIAATLALATAPFEVAGASGAADRADAQALVYEINLARWDPAAYRARSGVAIPQDTLPRPPLAINQDLGESARFKADEIATSGYFAHQSAVTGLWPNRLARDHGYPLPGLFPDDDNNIESLHGGSPVPFNVLESFAQSPSHRVHVFGQGWFFATHREIGVGRSTQANYWAVHTAYRSEADTFVTGVAYRDANGNGRMDPGEGLSGVTVIVGDRSTTTNAGGGYSLKVASGKYAVAASGGVFGGTASATIRVRSHNVGVDFVSGRAKPVIRDYQLCMGEEPTILGTGGDDTIRGTDGRDVIHGLGGKDVINGLGGNDLICGGGGDDTINGGSGNDRVLGSWGNDRLRGGAGTDTIAGGRGSDACVGAQARSGCEARTLD